MPYVGGENSGGTAIVEVANYSALPAANTVTGGLYAALASQGTAWLPGSWGGTYYPKGLYYSDGSNWIFTDTPYNANQATVDAGTNDDSFVTPKTFTNASKWGTKEDTSNKSNSQGDIASTSKFPVWAAVVTYVTGLGYLTSATAAATYQVILTASNFGTFLTGLTGKTTPVDADEIVISDSDASNVAKKVTLTNFLAYLKAYFDPLYTNIIYSSAVDSTPTSGTSNTLCTGVLISANTYSNGKRLRALVRVRKNNTVGTVTLRVYVNSTNDLSGATLLGTYVSAAGHYFITSAFNYPFKSSTTVERFSATFSVASDEHAGGISLVPVTFTFDSTANRYLIFALQNSSASDTSYISYLTVEKL